MLDLLLLTALIVFIIDLSGFVDEIVKRLYDKYIGKGDYHTIIPKLKPFSCSLCMTFWTGLIYLLITAQFNILMISYVALLAFMTPVIGDFLQWVKDLLTKLIDFLYKF